MTKKNVIVGVLLKAGDDATPLPIKISDLESIQGYVGGYIDAVTMTYDPKEMFTDPKDCEPFVCVGYVHDEGAVLGLPVNELASAVFNQNLFGDVVMVSGTSPSGKYDGDNYDLPDWFVEGVFTHLRSAIEMGRKIYDALGTSKKFLAVAVKDGIVTSDEIVEMMMRATAEGSQQDRDDMQALVVYGYRRLCGDIPDPQVSAPLPSEWEITDEELAEFLSETGDK